LQSVAKRQARFPQAGQGFHELIYLVAWRRDSRRFNDAQQYVVKCIDIAACRQHFAD
jgi:hypothetical protein